MNEYDSALPPSPALLNNESAEQIRNIRDQLYANQFTRTARKCFRVPVANRRRILHADEFQGSSQKPQNSQNLEHFEVDQAKICKSLNLPLSRKPVDDNLKKYGPFRLEKCTDGELSKKYEYYNRTVGDSIRSMKEQNAHLKKISNFRQFLRNKRESDELPFLEAKYAYGNDVDDRNCMEDVEKIPVKRIDYERFEISKKDSLKWLNRAMQGQLPSRPVEREVNKIKEYDDLSRILIKQETLDFNREKGTKKYRGKVIQPKVNSWLTQQDYEDIKERCTHGKTGQRDNEAETGIRLLYPNRNADWTLQKKLYQGKEDGHNAVFSTMNRNGKKNYGYDNDLLYWPLNEKGYIVDGTIDKIKKYI
jgi:hypothetical protein